MARLVKFDGYSFPIDQELSMGEAQALLSEAYPAIADATGAVDGEGNFVFTKTAGTKGC